MSISGVIQILGWLLPIFSAHWVTLLLYFYLLLHATRLVAYWLRVVGNMMSRGSGSLTGGSVNQQVLIVVLASIWFLLNDHFIAILYPLLVTTRNQFVIDINILSLDQYSSTSQCSKSGWPAFRKHCKTLENRWSRSCWNRSVYMAYLVIYCPSSAILIVWWNLLGLIVLFWVLHLFHSFYYGVMQQRNGPVCMPVGNDTADIIHPITCFILEALKLPPV